MNPESVTLRVSAVRSQNPQGKGGAIFTGVEVDAKGARKDAKEHLVVKAPHWLLHTNVEVGQLWRVSGEASPTTINVNGFKIKETTLLPDAMELLRPSGEHIIALLAEGASFAGIGIVKARRMWDHFGEELYAILDAADAKRLEAIMPEEAAANLVSTWRIWGETHTLQDRKSVV